MHSKKRRDGYIALYMPDYISASKSGYVMEHVFIMEQHIGRRLHKDECVHHINRKKDDNRLSNLQLMTKREHMSLHAKERHEKKQMRHYTVAVRNVETCEVFKSTKEASQKYNIFATKITSVCKRKRKTAGGFHWEYYKEVINE